MSREYNFNDDLDAILSEFSAYSNGLIADTEKKPAAEEETAVAAATEKRDADPEGEAPAQSREKQEAAVEIPAAKPESARRIMPEAEKAEAGGRKETAADQSRIVKRGVPLSAAAEKRAGESETAKRRAGNTPVKQGAAEKRAKTAPEERAKKAAAEKDRAKKAAAREPVTQEPAKPKKTSAAGRIGGGIICMVFMFISVLALAWTAVNVHPDSGSGAASAAGAKMQLSDKLDSYMNNLASDALGELTYIRKIYTIQEGDTVAPAPDPSCYGSVPIERAAEVMDVVAKAEESGLLEGQSVMFSPDIDFYYDSEIKYYYDETILVICWKEVINGNTCSCCEVKIADASQFRRKIADDTFGASNQYYASTLSKQANAVVAMNADFYQFRDFGIVVYQRELYRYSESNYTGIYSLYNCIDNCFVTAEGDFLFTHKADNMSESELRQFLEENNVIFSIAFGPILVENGEVQECTWYPAGEPTTGYSRAGIGIYDKLHYFYMNLNHSPEKAARWTVTEFATHMHEKGINTAYGLDGGQTGELVFRNEPYNYIDFGAERMVSDIIYFATALPAKEAAE